MVFGPFDSGFNQTFELPEEYAFYPFEWITDESDMLDPIEFLQESSSLSLPPKDVIDDNALPAPKPKYVYPLTIVIESINENSNTGDSISLINSQSTFIKFIQKEQDVYGLKVVKQKIIVILIYNFIIL